MCRGDQLHKLLHVLEALVLGSTTENNRPIPNRRRRWDSSAENRDMTEGQDHRRRAALPIGLQSIIPSSAGIAAQSLADKLAARIDGDLQWLLPRLHLERPLGRLSIRG